MLRVVTFLWRDANYRFDPKFVFSADHVNRLKNSVKRHLKMDHEFVLIGDDFEGIDEDIRCVPIWDNLRYLKGAYTKLKIFSDEMAKVIGERFVVLDLDCVVVGELDPLFDREEDFVIFGDGQKKGSYRGSMYMMDAGSRKSVWEVFDGRISKELTKHAGFKESGSGWISYKLGPDEAKWTKEDGVLGLKDVDGVKLPDSARIVFFDYGFDPSMPEVQERYDWIEPNWH